MVEAVGFPPKVMHSFVKTLCARLGAETLSSVLDKAGLPGTWAQVEHFAALDEVQSARSYGELQAALRLYYGRGARGILLNIGSQLWENLLKSAAFGLKTQAATVRGLPSSARRKPALALLSRMISAKPGDYTVHTLDLDLLFADHVSVATVGQSDSAPICFVTLGMIRECLYWAVGVEHDIEEISCRAVGAKDCEFKIMVGG
jgi:predicted hydrocarbon binding protein